MSRLIQAGETSSNRSAAGSIPPSPMLSTSGGHGIPLGRANVSQVAKSIDIAAVKAIE